MSLTVALTVIAGILALTAIIVVVLKDLVTILLSTAAAKLAEMFPVWYRANLYFWSAFILSLSDKIGGILMNDEWPSLQRTCGAFLIGLGVGLVTLRAYSDGSSQRLGDAIQARKDSKKPDPIAGALY